MLLTWRKEWRIHPIFRRRSRIWISSLSYLHCVKPLARFSSSFCPVDTQLNSYIHLSTYVLLLCSIFVFGLTEVPNKCKNERKCGGKGKREWRKGKWNTEREGNGKKENLFTQFSLLKTAVLLFYVITDFFQTKCDKSNISKIRLTFPKYSEIIWLTSQESPLFSLAFFSRNKKSGYFGN